MSTTRALRFHEYGEPADVLRLDEVPAPTPAGGRVPIRVDAIRPEAAR